MFLMKKIKLFIHSFSQQLTTIFGVLFFTGMMSVGYFYNVTFIQLGLTDLMKHTLGINEQLAAGMMAALAVLALITALLFGVWLMKTNRSADFIFKLRSAFGVVVVQTILTLTIIYIRTEVALYGWVALAAITLGIGMPATFSLTVDLVPRRWRGMTAGLITAIAYFASNAFSSSTWQMEHFRNLSLIVMLPGCAVLALIIFAKLPVLQRLAAQHQRPEFSHGRFVQVSQDGKPHIQRSLAGILVLMFGVFFIDSLGFLRLLETPLYMTFAWQSNNQNIHLFIALTHVAAALIGGILYTYLSERHIFAWIFGLFALTHLFYCLHTRVGPVDYAPLIMPMLYAIAVSLYTVINFAIWADISTPQNISLNTAIGVSLSGWTATFLSTALSMQWRAIGVSLERHLNIVDALAVAFFLGILLFLFFYKRKK